MHKIWFISISLELTTLEFKDCYLCSCNCKIEFFKNCIKYDSFLITLKGDMASWFRPSIFVIFNFQKIKKDWADFVSFKKKSAIHVRKKLKFFKCIKIDSFDTFQKLKMLIKHLKQRHQWSNPDDFNEP